MSSSTPCSRTTAEPDTHSSLTESALRLTKAEAQQLAEELSDVVETWTERTRGHDASRRTYLYYAALLPHPETRTSDGGGRVSTTHPLWRPYELVTPEELARAKVGDATPWPVQVVAPDPGWPAAYEQVRAGLVTALGDRALAVAHVGSTSVRGLWAKPIIDIDLTVADSADEQAWLPDLEAAGFVLHFREPEWEEHRLLKHPSRRPTCTSSRPVRSSRSGTSPSPAG